LILDKVFGASFSNFVLGFKNLGPLAALAVLGMAAVAVLAKFAIATRDLPITIHGFGDIFNLARSFFQQFLTLTGLRQKRRYWGTVYDSLNKQPLDPAIIELIEAATGKMLEQCITDLLGRFGFLERPGEFFIKAQKTNYEFPSTRITGLSDGVFDNIYHGEKLEVRSAENVLAPNIPMDPVGFDWNQAEKRRLGLGKLNTKSESFVIAICNFIFWLGFAAMIYMLVTNPTTYNIVFTVIYLGMSLVLKLIPDTRLWGRIISNSRKVDGLLIELSYPKLNVIVGKAVTNSRGRFFLKTPEQGRYALAIKTVGENSETLAMHEVNVGRTQAVTNTIKLS